MALDRQSIEKKDFPIGRRGYEPDAVDAHLRSLAEEIEELKSTSRRRSETLASAASERVRSIVEAAERSADEIQSQAEEDARDIREEASSEAQRTREQATEQAREYVGKVNEASSTMLQRLDAMESELGGLVDSLRTGANRLTADLSLLQGNLTELSEVAGPSARFEREPEEAAGAGDRAALGGEPEGIVDTGGEPVAVAEGGEPIEQIEAGETLEVEEDDEGARLVALDMALNGTPREETDRYLADHFQLADRAGLLDEVYESVGE